MDIAIKVLNQVIVVFLLICVGFISTKKNLFNKDGIRQMTNMLLNIVTPCVLIDAYQQKDFSADLTEGLLFGLLLSFLSIGLTLILSKFIFKREITGKYKVNRAASAYSNCGFMAIPLISAALGADGVFYASSYLVIFTFAYWTIGVFTYTENIKDLSFLSIVKSPGVIGVFIGLTLYFLRVKLPDVIIQPISYLSALNTPVAMIVLGSYLVNVDFKKMLKENGIYIVSLLRLIIYPLITLALAKIINIDSNVAQAIMISASCPCATISTLFASKYDVQAEYSAQLVSINTLMSIITIPVIMYIVGIVL